MGLRCGKTAGISLLFAASAAPSAAAEEPALRRVLLTTGGVGYFEHQARVVGDAELQIEVRLDQVSDVLKSIVVFDDQGRIGRVSLPGREPLREVFRDLPFSQGDLESLVSLLRALRGAEVRITTAGSVIEGRLASISAETLAAPEGGRVTRHRVTVLAEQGIRQAVLEDADAIVFLDERLQAQLERALAALAGQGEREKRTLTLRIEGEGERLVRIGYVAEVPLWKASYRLALGEEAGQALLQGWAVVENLSGRDWEGVDLTVVAGHPVTFRQALYEAYYVDRPEVPVEVLGRILPKLDVGAVPAPTAAPAPPMARAAPMAPPAFDKVGEEERKEGTALAGLLAAAGAEAMTQVVFRFPGPIDLEQGRTLMLPIVSGPIPAERISLYQRETDPLHPLASVRLVNDTGVGWPPGAVTMYERAPGAGDIRYLGDAQMGPLPAGEDRLLSYAVDLKVRVDRDEQRASVITDARIVDGVLHVVRTEQRRTAYTLAGAAEESRVVVIEHPRVPGSELTEPEGAVIGRTPEDYRIRQEVPAGATVEVEVVLERPIQERFELLAMGSREIGVLVAAPRIPEATRQALARVQALRQELEAREAAAARLEEERAAIVADQARVRENLGAVPPESDLYRRYLATLSEQENRLEALRGEIEAARQAALTAREALAAFVRGLGS